MHSAIDTGVSGSTKTDWYLRYGPLDGSSAGLAADCNLGYDAANPYVYNRTQPSGWPDTRAATNTIPFQFDGWTVFELFLEYNTVNPAQSTIQMWVAPRGSQGTKVIDCVGTVPFGSNTANSWKQFELDMYDTSRQPEAARPDQDVYFGEFITSLRPIKFPGQTVNPPGNLG
jgi:hypothetical protein